MVKSNFLFVGVARRAEKDYDSANMILTDESLLRRPCADASPEEVGELVSLLERELEQSAKLGRPGIGLAASQIGILKNVAIVRINKEYKIDLVNAKIANGYDEVRFVDEGCLSFPGRAEDTMRYQEVHLTGNLVYPHGCILQGLIAVVAQHELDHCNGILLPDLAIPKLKQKRPGPNDPCICGKTNPFTGQVIKYKKCCGSKENKNGR
jgi:peptide deformylase